MYPTFTQNGSRKTTNQPTFVKVSEKLSNLSRSVHYHYHDTWGINDFYKEISVKMNFTVKIKGKGLRLS